MKKKYNYNLNPQGIAKIKSYKMDYNLSCIVNIIDRLLKKNDSINIFEPGCGGGRNLEFLKNKFGNQVKVFGSDISDVSIDYAKNKSNISGNFIVAKTIDDCFEDKFDLIIMLDILEHLPSIDEVDKTLKLAKKNLNNDGIVFISCPIEKNKFSICWFFKKINFWTDLTQRYYGHTIEFSDNLVLDLVKKYFKTNSVTYGVHFLSQLDTLLFFYTPKQLMRFLGGEKTISSFRQSNIEISQGNNLRYFITNFLLKIYLIARSPFMVATNYESKLRRKSKVGAMNIQVECQ